MRNPNRESVCAAVARIKTPEFLVQTIRPIETSLKPRQFTCSYLNTLGIRHENHSASAPIVWRAEGKTFAISLNQCSSPYRS
jgi:hypothetical protein